MVYIKFVGGNGYCGCDWEEYQVFEEFNEKEFDEILEELSYENAESYEYIATGLGEDFETEDDREDYYDRALSEGNWFEVTEEEYEENC